MDGPVYHLEGVVKAKEAGMEDFVGPLDLILHLLSKNKIEIRDIQISVLLDQYLEWMERREKLNLEVASEFVAMAAHLIYIKSPSHSPDTPANQTRFTFQTASRAFPQWRRRSAWRSI